MSKFKSFASQGSFRDYQLQAPDESAKIKEETARVIRGKEKAEQFRQGNAALYLQAQKLAQGLQEQNRETNFRLETENRQAFKNQLTQEYELQVRANKEQAAAQQKTFKDLSSFSKTAFELYNTIDQKITENQTKANAARAYAAGADYNTTVAIQSLTDNLTKAEFAQQDFIRDIIAKGGNLDAYYALYEARKTRGFINNMGVAQNTAHAFHGASQAFLQDYIEKNPNATVEQKKLAYKTFESEYAASFTDASGRSLNPELLNSTVYPIMRRISTQAMSQFDRDLEKERQQTVFDDAIEALNFAHENKGAAGVIEWFTTNPSREKREILAKWMQNRSTDLGPTGLSDTDIDAILNYKYDGPNTAQTGKQTYILDQFKGSNEVGIMLEAAKNYRRAQVGETKLQETEAKIELDSAATNLYNQIAADGNITAQDVAQLEELHRVAGIPGYESPALTAAREQQDSVRYDEAAKTILDKELAAGNLKVERIQSMKGISAQLKQQYLNLAVQQQRQRETPAYKTDVAAIKAAVSQDPRVKAAPVTGKENYSVLLMQDRFVRQYKETLQRTGSNDEARAVTLAAIQTLLANPKSITKEGLYADVVQQEAQFAAKGKGTLENYKEFVNVLSDPDVRNNPTKLANTLGAATVYSAYDDMQAGKPASAIIKNGAALMGMAPIDFVNYLASGANDPNMKPITLDTQVEEIRQNMKPITRRLYNVNRTNERINRGNQLTFGGNYSSSSVPKRPSMVPTSKPGADGLTRAAQGHITYGAHPDLYINFGKFLQELGFKVGEHEAFGGVTPNVHKPYGFHPWNEGMDITDHRPGDWLGRTTRFKQEMRYLGLFKQVLGPGDAGHDTHVDLGGLMRVPTQEELDYLRSIFKLN